MRSNPIDASRRNSERGFKNRGRKIRDLEHALCSQWSHSNNIELNSCQCHLKKFFMFFIFGKLSIYKYILWYQLSFKEKICAFIKWIFAENRSHQKLRYLVSKIRQTTSFCLPFYNLSNLVKLYALNQQSSIIYIQRNVHIFYNLFWWIEYRHYLKALKLSPCC